MRDEQLSIGELARRTGVSAQAIRYYERVGLLPRPARAENGYRRYGALDVNRIVLLHRLRALGTPLAVAKPVVEHAAEARCAEIRQDMLVVVDTRLAEIDHEIAMLRRQRVEVDRYRLALMAVCVGETMRFSACDNASCVTQPETCNVQEVSLMANVENGCCESCPTCGECCELCDCGCCQSA